MDLSSINKKRCGYGYKPTELRSGEKKAFTIVGSILIL